MPNLLVKLDWCGYGGGVWLRVKYILRNCLDRGPNETTAARLGLGVPSYICLWCSRFRIYILWTVLIFVCEAVLCLT